MRTRSFFLTSIVVVLLPLSLLAQSTVTFRVDMGPAIEDSTFIPTQHTVQIKGNQLPFSNIRTIKMWDVAPRDSIYTAEVQFPSIVNGRELIYRFLIKKQYDRIEEMNARFLHTSQKDTTLQVVGFNQFMY